VLSIISAVGRGQCVMKACASNLQNKLKYSYEEPA